MSRQPTKGNKKAPAGGKKDEEKPVEYEEFTSTAKFTYPNGEIYIGEFKQLTTGQKIREGKGKYISSKVEDPANPPQGVEWYDGQWVNDQMEGYGIYHYSNGDIYEGQWKNNMHHGTGSYTFTNGSKYIGEWSEHKMNGTGKYLNLKNKGWNGEFKEGGFHSKDQSDLLEKKRINNKIENYKNIPKEFYRVWDDTYNKADKKTIKDQLSPFFAKQEVMGAYINETFPKFEERGPDKWNDAFKFCFSGTTVGKAPPAPQKGGDKGATEAPKVNVTINVPTTGEDLIFMNKEGLLTKQVQEELSNGQVIEVYAVLEPRKVCLGLGYNKEMDKWQIVFFSDVTEKAGKK